MELFEELATVLSRLDSEGIDYALCGGLAMAVHAFPRSTLDIDLMIDPVDLDAVREVARGLGFTLDTGLMRLGEGKVSIYRMAKAGERDADPLVLDLLLVSEDTRDAWDTRTRLPWQEGDLSVVSPEGLIKLKTMRGSGQDQDDIDRLRSLSDEN
jgi:hypothetical protein